MLKFKNSKLVECTQKEFDKIKSIYDHSSCFAGAQAITYVLLVSGQLQYKTKENCKYLSTTVVKDMAFNVLMAVVNKYKYLKVV